MDNFPKTQDKISNVIDYSIRILSMKLKIVLNTSLWKVMIKSLINEIFVILKGIYWCSRGKLSKIYKTQSEGKNNLKKNEI